MSDLISRQAVLDELEKWDWQELYLPIHFKQILDDVQSVENKGEWIPITYRPMTDEEKEHYSVQVGCDKEDLDTMLDCQLPDDGEEVLITVFGEVETDIFYRDVDGCSFENRDIDDVTAWMPKPKPYKAKKPETCKGCLEPCIMYEPDMRACKKKVTERGE